MIVIGPLKSSTSLLKATPVCSVYEQSCVHSDCSGIKKRFFCRFYCDACYQYELLEFGNDDGVIQPAGGRQAGLSVIGHRGREWCAIKI